MDIINTIIALISGAVGGNIAGAAMKQKNLGVILNTIGGLIGGGLGEFLLKAAGIITAAQAGPGGELDITSILASVVGGGVGGGALTGIITMIKDAMEKK